MKDLTKERLAELKRLHDAKEDLMIGSEEFHALLDMASRCVSEETVTLMRLAIRLDTAGGLPRRALRDFGSNPRHELWGEFNLAAERDLRESAEARAREGR